jgi:hypothetical protein
MLSSEPARPNDPYAWIDRYAADLHQAARTLARSGEASRVPDEVVAQLLTAAIRLGVAKADGESEPSTRSSGKRPRPRSCPRCRSCCGQWLARRAALGTDAAPMRIKQTKEPSHECHHVARSLSPQEVRVHTDTMAAGCQRDAQSAASRTG